jgi:hypothetical protein
MLCNAYLLEDLESLDLEREEYERELAGDLDLDTDLERR